MSLKKFKAFSLKDKHEALELEVQEDKELKVEEKKDKKAKK